MGGEERTSGAWWGGVVKDTGSECYLKLDIIGLNWEILTPSRPPSQGYNIYTSLTNFVDVFFLRSFAPKCPNTEFRHSAFPQNAPKGDSHSFGAKVARGKCVLQ